MKIETEFTGLPLRKLNELEHQGWSVNGVHIQRTQEDGTLKHGAVTTGGMVLWWPQQAAEPGHFVVVHRRTTPSGRHSHTVECDRPLPIGCVLHTYPAPTQQDSTNGVVALQERLRQDPVALQPLTDEEAKDCLPKAPSTSKTQVWFTANDAIKAIRNAEEAHGIKDTHE